MDLSRARIEAATSALGEVIAFTAPADMALRRFFREHPQLGQHDRAFVAETVFTVVRNLRLLEALARTRSPRRLLLAALAVHLGFSARQLSSLLSDAEQTWLNTARSTEQSSFSPPVRFSLPDWLYERLSQQYETADLEALARGMLQPAPLDLRVNTMSASRDEILAALKQDGIAAAATRYSPAGVRLRSKPALQQHPLFLAGKVEVQDEGSQLLAYLVAPRRREMVVDFCAGAGGKTLALGALMSSEGRLYAFDTSDKRLTQFKPRLKRSQLSNVHPQLVDSESDTRIKRLAAKIDRVLVDAPCSAFGTLRRNPDLKWRQSAETIARMTERQASILAAASRLVKPGGRLVYATCSILREENEAIAEQFLASNGGFVQLDCSELLQRQGIALDTGPFFRVLPHTHEMDGFFAAAFERVR